MSSDVWSRVAAAGTDPAALRGVVALLVSPGPSELGTRLRAAAEDVGPEPEDILRVVLDQPTLLADDDVARTWSALGVTAALAGDPMYPARLAAGWPATGGPALLAWRGPAAVPPAPRVAIVGARRATPYGTGVAAWLAEAASEAGVHVVSGGALGIDAAAHRGALGGGGGTTVVLGCGHDVAYPRPHAVADGLFDQVLAAGGCLLSESLPYQTAQAHRVRARNRIVAGLADAVVVVEGGARSGALITAGNAADLGVQVMAVPGDVRAPLSAAPHRLLTEGAAPCTSPGDLLDALGRVAPDAPDAATASVLPDAVRTQLAVRWPRPIRTDELAAASGVGIGPLLAALTRARLAGEIVEAPEGLRLARAPA